MRSSCNFLLAVFITILKEWSCIGLTPSGSQQSTRNAGSGKSQSTSTLDLVMPRVRPSQADEYLCTSTKLANVEQYITKFKALAEASRAHHILIYGCEEVMTTQPYWHCGAMCSNGSPRILFAWAKNAPPTQLPQGVAFKVGPGTGAQYLILQIHYNSPLKSTDPDDESGVQLSLSSQQPKYVAGILLFVAYEISIPPHTQKTHADISCQYPGRTVLYPFAFRVHAHSLGKVITAYHKNDTWYQLGKGNPQWPQAFYPITENHAIRPNEYLAARCTYDSTTRSTRTTIGGSHNDEMCNFYMMYYTDFARGASFIECAGNEIPKLIRQLPPGSDTPLPPNPALEEIAAGHHHHNIMPGAKAVASVQPNPHPANPGAGLGQNLGQNPPAYGNQRSGRYPDLNRYDTRFLNRPYSDTYDYYSLGGGGNGGGGGGDNFGGGRDYFYDEVANQRSRNRRPSLDRYDNDNDDSAGAFFGFSDNDDDSYYGSQGRYRGRTGQPSMSYSDRMNAYDLINDPQQSQLSKPSRGGHAESMLNPHGSRPPPPQGRRPSNHNNNNKGSMPKLTPRISAKKGPLKPHPGGEPHPTRKAPTVPPPSPRPLPTSKSSINMHVKTHASNGFIDAVPNWPTIVESDHVKLGQVSGVAVDSHDNVFVFHRGSRIWEADSFTADDKFTKAGSGAIPENAILQFDQLGELKDQWGKNAFFLPHGLHIDEDDNLWLTDVAMHQVFMYKKGSKTPNLTLGTRMIPGSDSKHFCKPTDVATTKSGFVFIADGYCNARIMKFTKNGTFIKEWGKPTESNTHNGVPADGTFNIPHSITALEDHGWVCVADRENGRIQCFDYDGKFVKNIHLEGFHSRLFAVTYSKKDKVLYAVNGPTALKSAPIQGFVVDPDTGNLISTFVPGKNAVFSMPHDISVNNKGDQIYVGEIIPSKLWDFKVHQDQLTVKLAAVKKSNRVASAGSLQDMEDSADNIDDIPGDFGASIVIGLLLVVPIVIIVSITVFLRLKKKGKIPFLSNYKNRNRRFNLGNFFSRHNGFDRVKTEDGDELDHLNSDSDVEEYSATAQKA